MEAIANKHPDPTTKKNLLELVGKWNQEVKQKGMKLSNELNGKQTRKRTRTETEEDPQLTRKSPRIE